MPNTPLNIFVVDDNSLFRMMIVDQLSGNNYHIEEFASGEECYANLHASPHLILLDIEMPGENGIDVCRQIRAAGHTEVQIIFVTAHDDLDMLLQAYEAGGNDFIHKNAPKELLLRKIFLAIGAGAQKQQLRAQFLNAQKVAFTAMSSLGETGILLEFLRSSFSCENLHQLGALISEVLQRFGLKGLVRLSDDFDEYDFGSAVICSPLEQSILSYVAKMGHIFQTQDRLVLNFPHITLLLMELQLDDQEAVGRLRDNLAILAEGTSVRIQAMTAEKYQLLNAQQVALTAMSSLGETGVMLQFLRNSFGCENLQQLGQLIVETLQQFQLKALIRLSDEAQELDLGCGMACADLEQQKLTDASKLGRVYQADDYLALNYPHISLLIVELNVKDVELIGRLRDHLAIMAEGTGLRITAMSAEHYRFQSAQQVALTAMSSLGETGIMLQFLRASFTCETLQQLGELVMDTLQQFALTGLIRLTNAEEECDLVVGLDPRLPVTALLNQAAQMDPIQQIGDRLMVNYPHTTLLIFDLAVSDTDAIGRLRDNLAIIAEGTGVRIDAMMAEQYRLGQANAQLTNIKELNGVFEQVEQLQSDNKAQFEHLIHSHRADMENAFISLGLTDAQESSLHQAVERLSEEMEQLFSNDYVVSMQLREIIARQKQMLNLR